MIKISARDRLAEYLPKQQTEMVETIRSSLASKAPFYCPSQAISEIGMASCSSRQGWGFFFQALDGDAMFERPALASWASVVSPLMPRVYAMADVNPHDAQSDVLDRLGRFAAMAAVLTAADRWEETLEHAIRVQKRFGRLKIAGLLRPLEAGKPEGRQYLHSLVHYAMAELFVAMPPTLPRLRNVGPQR